jgi:hypothetical protein
VQEDGRGLAELSGYVHDDTAILELKSHLRGYRRLVAPVQVIAYEVDAKSRAMSEMIIRTIAVMSFVWGVDQQLLPCATLLRTSLAGRPAAIHAAHRVLQPFPAKRCVVA